MLSDKTRISNMAELIDFAHRLCDLIHDDSILMLSGELGVGKTTLSSYVLKNLVNDTEDFTSPTFNIVHEYYSKSKQCRIYHMDLYRIKDIEELYAIGFLDMLSNGIMLIEWPDIADPILKKFAADRLIMVELSFVDEVNTIACLTTSCKFN